MDRRGCLVAVGTIALPLAGCSGADQPEDEPRREDDDGEVVLRERVGGQRGTDGGTGGIDEGGADGGRTFPRGLAAGDRLDVETHDPGYVTELEARAPDGELVVERSISEPETVTVEAEQDGEYTAWIAPDSGVDVELVLYSAEDRADGS